jgi:hypothetical protein
LPRPRPPPGPPPTNIRQSQYPGTAIAHAGEEETWEEDGAVGEETGGEGWHQDWPEPLEHLTEEPTGGEDDWEEGGAEGPTAGETERRRRTRARGFTSKAKKDKRRDRDWN